MKIDIEAKAAKTYIKGKVNNKYNLALSVLRRIEKLSNTKTIIGKAVLKEQEGESFD